MSDPVKIQSLIGDEKEWFEERMAICLESGVDELQAEIIALREIGAQRKTGND